MISASEIELEDGPVIHLASFAPDPEDEGKAKDFLRRIVTRRRILLKFDRTQWSREKPWLAYAYVLNDTTASHFVFNLGLAKVDMSHMLANGSGSEATYRGANKYQLNRPANACPEKTAMLSRGTTPEQVVPERG